MFHKMMQIILIFLLLGFSLSATVPSGGDKSHLAPTKVLADETVVEAVVEVSKNFFRRFPAGKYVVIGIGRSPTPFMAFLQGVAEEYAWNLPLSNFRYGEFYNGKIVDELNEAECQQLFQHFALYLPSERAIRGRNIVVLDFADTSASLIAATKYIKKYIAKLDLSASVEPVALTTGRKKPDTKHKILIPQALHDYSNLQLFDRLSEFGTFDLQKSGFESKIKRVTSEIYRSLQLQLSLKALEYLQQFDSYRMLFPYDYLELLDKKLFEKG